MQPLPIGTGRREAAIETIGRFVAEAGQLLVITIDRAGQDLDAIPPWPPTRAEIESFATGA